MNADDRAVWITGVGAWSGLGRADDDALDALLAGRSALAPDATLGDLAVAHCASPPADRAARHLDRAARLFLAAAEDAWRDAGLTDGGPEAASAVVQEGSSLGPLADLLTARDGRATGSVADPRGLPIGHPADLVRFMPGAGGAAFAARHGLGGPVLHVSAGSVSSAAAIGEAFLRIARGEATLAVAGGAECPLERTIVATFHRAGILAPVEEGCRPFAPGRAGTTLGEGAGALILEDAASARRRGARPYARLTGYGFATVGTHPTAPDPEGRDVAQAIRSALDGTAPEDLVWIKTHGTGTRLNDAAECRGLAAALGEHLENIPLAALKPALGHTLGASGAVEAVYVLLALCRGQVPGIARFEQADPCLPGCRPLAASQSCRAGSVLLLSESFGGRAVALVLRKEDSTWTKA